MLSTCALGVIPAISALGCTDDLGGEAKMTTAPAVAAASHRPGTKGKSRKSNCKLVQ